MKTCSGWLLSLPCVVFFLDAAAGRGLDVDDLTQLVFRLGDEANDVLGKQEEDVPHPVLLHNWAHGLDVGKVTGVSVDPDDRPVIFHRGPVDWEAGSFDRNNRLRAKTPIKEDTIMVLDKDTGDVVHSFGSGKFYMPHGITVDLDGNIFVTDVGLHQVFRFPKDKKEPDLVLGVAFEPGSDEDHFCKPTAIAVSESTGDFFVADGYCNSRIMKYSKEGKLMLTIGGDWNIPHSLALFEKEDVLCVADREGQRVDCVKAGTKQPLFPNHDDAGQKVMSYGDGLVGRVYGIASKGEALLALSGAPDVGGVTIDTVVQDKPVIDVWGRNDDLQDPHDVAISLVGDAVYVADGSKLKKFEVISAQDEPM